MSRVRVLAGTRKGAFILTSDAGREHWEVAAFRPVAAARLLRQRPARRDGGRHARPVRRLLRDHRRAGVLLGRRRRHLDADCA